MSDLWFKTMFYDGEEPITVKIPTGVGENPSVAKDDGLVKQWFDGLVAGDPDACQQAGHWSKIRLEVTVQSDDFRIDEDLIQRLLPVQYVIVRFAQYPFSSELATELKAKDPSQCGISWLWRLTNCRRLHLREYPFGTIPEELGKLSDLRYICAYGSNLHRLPRSIGHLRNLKGLDLYTSYQLHYLPGEVVRCQLRESRFSTRALLNNHKNALPMPLLRNPTEAVRASFSSALIGETLARCRNQSGSELPRGVISIILGHLGPWDRCTLCSRQYVWGTGAQVWSHQMVGTDEQGLLSCVCSLECASVVPNQVLYNKSSRRNEATESSMWTNEIHEDTFKTDETTAYSLPPYDRPGSEYYDFYAHFEEHIKPYDPDWYDDPHA